MNAGITFIVCLALLGFYFTGYLIGKSSGEGKYSSPMWLEMLNAALIVSAVTTALYVLIKMITISIQIH